MTVLGKDGKEYPEKTLYKISCDILKYLRDREIQDKNFLDTADPRFAGFCKILESKIIKRNCAFISLFLKLLF